MAKILTLDEMLEVVSQQVGCDEALVAHWRWALETVGNQVAEYIARLCDVQAGPCESEELAFAGTCAPFYPKYPGQPVPEELEPFDQCGDWEPHEYVGDRIAALANQEDV